MAGHLNNSETRQPGTEATSRVSLLIVGSSSLGVLGSRAQDLKVARTQASITNAASLPRAMDLMRVMSFDLVVVSEDLAAAKVIRRLWSWQPWVYVGCRVMADEEIAARSLGATAVLDELDSPEEQIMPVLIELAQVIADRATERSISKHAG
jgi:hypothetical protein